MNNEIKEILKDNDELLVNYKDGSFECFDTLPQNVLDYITNLQEENKSLKANVKLLDDNRIYLNDKIDEAIEYLNKVSYMQEPYKNTLLNILRGEDNE